MANYIAWYGKKRERLADCGKKFAALLQSEHDASKVSEAAEEVRAAQVRALKSKRAEFPPSEKNAQAVAELDREIASWLALPVEQIIDRYRGRK